MNSYTYIGLIVVGEITLMITRVLMRASLEMRWRDLPALMAILFGASPYGRICYNWFAARLNRLLK